MADYHVPVLFNESIEALNIKPEGIYVDVTFGAGGHSRGILDKLTTGKLIAFDQDIDAYENLKSSKTIDIEDKRFVFFQSNFRYISNFLAYLNIDKVDGLLADLGISSHQIDDAERGFSYRFDKQLDMRMNQQQRLSAARLIAEYSEQELTVVFRKYGELDNAYKVARKIVETRTLNPIHTTGQLVEVVSDCFPKHKLNGFLSKIFQALRIEINQELQVLEALLLQTEHIIRKDGRLAILTYHSLEDRLVKNYIAKGNLEGISNKDFYGNELTSFEPFTRKPIVPEDAEIESNSRARSAKLRIGVKR